MDRIQRTAAIEHAASRSALYRLLAKSFLYPAQQQYAYLTGNGYGETLSQLQMVLRHDGELSNEITEFLFLHRDWRGSQDREQLEAEYNRLFAHLGSTKCPPYETEYGLDNIYQKTEAMADIGGFYFAFGLDIAQQNTDRVDFISTEMEFMSFLAMKEAYALERQEQEHEEICRDAQQKFLAEHLGRWVSMFVTILSLATDNRFYAGLGALTKRFIDSEARNFGVALQKITEPGNASSSPPVPFQCDACLAADTADPSLPMQIRDDDKESRE